MIKASLNSGYSNAEDITNMMATLVILKPFINSQWTPMRMPMYRVTSHRNPLLSKIYGSHF